MPDATSPDVHIKLLIGELVWTIAQLEAQKAALTQQVAMLTAQVKPEPGD